MFRTIGNWLNDYWLECAVLLSSAIYGACALVLSDEIVGLFPKAWQCHVRCYGIIGAGLFWLLLIGFSIAQICKRERLSSLEASINTLRDQNRVLAGNIRSLVDGYLFSLAAGRLGFGGQPANTERITLYLFDPEGHFVPVGRYSANPAFQPPGRGVYPSTKGCICRAWENDWFFDAGFPDPDEDYNAYVEAHRNFGIAKTTVERLSMRSRLYCGCKIHGKNGQEPIAVVVVESTDPDRFTEGDLKEVLDQEMRFFSDLAEGVRPHVVNPSDIREMGL